MIDMTLSDVGDIRKQFEAARDRRDVDEMARLFRLLQQDHGERLRAEDAAAKSVQAVCGDSIDGKITKALTTLAAWSFFDSALSTAAMELQVIRRQALEARVAEIESKLASLTAR